MRDIVIVTVVATLCAAFLDRQAPPPPPHLAAAGVDIASGDWRSPPGRGMKHG